MLPVFSQIAHSPFTARSLRPMVASRDNEGMSNATNSTEPERLALPAVEVAKLLGISERHAWALNSSGRLPRPVHLGRAVRWNLAELRAWLDANCPERSRWEAMRKGAEV